MCPEYPRKDRRGKSCWLNLRESGPEVVQGPAGVTTSPTLLGPILVWSQQNYLNLLLTMGALCLPGVAACTSLRRGKASMEMNE